MAAPVRAGIRSLLIGAAARGLLALGLSVAVFAQEPPQIVETTIGCREEPQPGSAGSVTILNAWISENALMVDLAVTNHSDSNIRIPILNTGGNYWSAVLYNADGESLRYCGGVSELNLHPLEEIVSESDIVTIKPGHTVTLRDIDVATFWPYLREPDYDARSFEVVYTGWSRITVYFDASESANLERGLKSAAARQCSLYGGTLQSPRHDVP
jgi:hypothetical protein